MHPSWMLCYNVNVLSILFHFKWYSLFVSILSTVSVHLWSIRAAEALTELSLQLCLTAALIGWWFFVMKPQRIFSAVIPAVTPTLGWVAPGRLSRTTVLCSMTVSLLNITCRTHRTVIRAAREFIIAHSPPDPLPRRSNKWTTADLPA